MFSARQLLTLTTLAASLRGARGMLSETSSTNVAVYWGQNSYGQGNGSLAQQDLAYYCQNTAIDVFQLAFVTRVNGVGGAPEINYANIGNNCTTFNGTNLLNCPQVGADIKTCQQLGKTILVSIGGATYSEGGFSSESAAVDGANLIWDTFGAPSSNSSAPRPFGDAVVDGFDFDFEANVGNMVPFANRLRTLMDADTSKKYFLTAAPQCPYPDLYDQDILNNVAMDAIWVQFYNNYCGVNSFVPGATTQNNFNFATWDTWAKNVSKNANVKVFMGVPANTGAAGSGYMSAASLAPVIAYSKTFSSFGGVMMWDASQAYANPGFISSVKASLLGTATNTTSSTILSPSSSRIRRASRLLHPKRIAD